MKNAAPLAPTSSIGSISAPARGHASDASLSAGHSGALRGASAPNNAAIPATASATAMPTAQAGILVASGVGNVERAYHAPTPASSAISPALSNAANRPPTI